MGRSPSTKTSLPSSKKRPPSSPSRTSSKPRTSKGRVRRARANLSPFEPYIRIFYSVHITVLLSCWLQQLTHTSSHLTNNNNKPKKDQMSSGKILRISGGQKLSPKNESFLIFRITVSPEEPRIKKLHKRNTSG